jgi:AcrR family transcriptional regulator
MAAQPGMDRRALRTRQALHDALIRLILERDYDEISVVDVADAANVGRSTFYAHFTDKDDLLRGGTERLRGILLAEHANAVAGEDQPGQRTLGFSAFMTAHLKERHDLYRAMMRGRAGPIILDRIREFLCDIVRGELAAAVDMSASRGQASEIAVQFLVGAYMSVLTWWLDRGAKEPPEQIDRTFRKLALSALDAL